MLPLTAMLELEKSLGKNEASRSRRGGPEHWRSNTKLTIGGLFLLTLSTRLPPLINAQAKCDLNSDACPYQFDGECDAGEFCLSDQDCFDCDEWSVIGMHCDSLASLASLTTCDSIFPLCEVLLLTTTVVNVYQLDAFGVMRMLCVLELPSVLPSGTCIP